MTWTLIEAIAQRVAISGRMDCIRRRTGNKPAPHPARLAAKVDPRFRDM